MGAGKSQDPPRFFEFFGSKFPAEPAGGGFPQKVNGLFINKYIFSKKKSDTIQK